MLSILALGFQIFGSITILSAFGIVECLLIPNVRKAPYWIFAGLVLGILFFATGNFEPLINVASYVVELYGKLYELSYNMWLDYFQSMCN